MSVRLPVSMNFSDRGEYGVDRPSSSTTTSAPALPGANLAAAAAGFMNSTLDLHAANRPLNVGNVGMPGQTIRGTQEPTGISGSGNIESEEARQRQAAIENLNSTQNMRRDQARGNLNNFRTQYGQDARNFVNQISDQQGDINRGKAANAHNFGTTIDAIAKGAQQGLRSGGVALAGMNASDSGAVDAMGRAYADVSNQQAGEANAQFGDQLDELMRGQSQLNRQRKDGMADLGSERDNKIAAERLWLENQLEDLNISSRGQGMDWRANQGMVSNVVDQAMSRLSQIDNRTRGDLGKVNAWDGDRVAQEAQQLREAGQPGRQFQFSRPGVQFGQGAAMPGQQMPLFVRNREDFAPALPGRGNEERR